MPFLNGTFILTITRVSPDNVPNKKKLHAKRKDCSANVNSYIYMFNTFDDFIDFCLFVTHKFELLINAFKKSTLYFYSGKYYLSLNLSNKNLNLLNNFHYEIIEFSSPIKNAKLFESKLKEYGNTIIKTNAINSSVKYFHHEQ